MITKHVKPTAAKPSRRNRKKEAEFTSAILMLVDPKTGLSN